MQWHVDSGVLMKIKDQEPGDDFKGSTLPVPPKYLSPFTQSIASVQTISSHNTSLMESTLLSLAEKAHLPTQPHGRRSPRPRLDRPAQELERGHQVSE